MIKVHLVCSLKRGLNRTFLWFYLNYNMSKHAHVIKKKLEPSGSKLNDAYALIIIFKFERQYYCVCKHISNEFKVNCRNIRL